MSKTTALSNNRRLGIKRIKIVDDKKQCTNCSEWKLLSEYSPTKRTDASGEVIYCQWCKPCEKNYRKEQARKRRANPDSLLKIKANEQKYYKKILAKKLDLGQGPSSFLHSKCCVVCNKAWVSKRRIYKDTCSPKCAVLHRASKVIGRKIERPEKEYKCRQCKEIFTNNHPGKCNKCIKLYKKAQKKKRIAAIKTVAIETVIDVKVFQRDKWRCKHCDIKVQKQYILRDDAAEVDHIVPLSLGGPHSYSNVQTLCRKCNQAKSNSYKGQLVMLL